jgi:hypothetical protein
MWFLHLEKLSFLVPSEKHVKCKETLPTTGKDVSVTSHGGRGKNLPKIKFRRVVLIFHDVLYPLATV